MSASARTLVVVAALLAMTGCGSDEDPAQRPTTTTEAEAASAPTAAMSVTLTASAIDGLPSDLAAGPVEVAVTDETSAGGEINFTRVEPGTDEETFVEGLLPIFDGGAFPDFLITTVGVTDAGTVALDEGEYIAWIDKALGEDELSTPDDIVTAPLTVAPGVDGAEVPSTDGTVTATDYHFDVDVAPGSSMLTFDNDSDAQFHHVLLVDFGTNDPTVVEEKLPELLASDEDAPPPEGLDMEQVDFEFARTSVFGPGASGTFEAELEAGHTYAALCFISDREGGAPHAMQHQMYEVFQA